MAKKSLPFDLAIAEALYNSAKDFPVDLDDAWRWIGYARKENAKNTLLSIFEEGLDYVLLEQESDNHAGLSAHQKAVAQRRVKIMLTVDCFKQIGMMAQTEKGKEIRRYFLECERKAKAIGSRRLSDQEVARLCVLGTPTIHVTRFEDVYYENLSRLTGLQAQGHKRPRWWAQLTKEWVYDMLPKGVTEALYQCREEHGGWEKLHQYLSEDGLAIFQKHMGMLIDAMGWASSVNDVRRMLRRKLAQHYQFELFEDCRKDGSLTISRQIESA